MSKAKWEAEGEMLDDVKSRPTLNTSESNMSKALQTACIIVHKGIPDQRPPHTGPNILLINSSKKREGRLGRTKTQYSESTPYSTAEVPDQAILLLDDASPLIRNKLG